MRSKLYLHHFFAILILAVFGINMNADAQMRQVYVDNLQPDNVLRKISLYQPNEGYAGFSQWVGFTTDTGRTFTKKYITTGNVNFNGYSVNLTFGFTINGVKAFNQNNLLVYGDYGLVPAILRSTDGANTFTLIYHSQLDPFALRTGITDMTFPENNNIGYAVDADRILKTTDQGITWNLGSLQRETYFTSLAAIDNNNVFAIGTGSGRIFKTVNGSFWSSVPLPSGTGVMRGAYFISPTVGWVSIDDFNNGYSFYKTTNAGASWTLQNDPEVTPFLCEKMIFTDDNTGYAIGNLYTTFKTLNSGVTWEALPRDNDFSYLGFGHNDLQVINNTQVMVGGGHGFLELSTNAGGTPLPSAFFKIDTTGSWNNQVVELVNYSRNVYTYKWLLNGTQIGTSYNHSYVRDINRTKDTITLIVNNGSYTDTLIKYQDFYPPVKIFSFDPSAGTNGTVVNITGENFNGAASVTFGGVAAASFTVVSSTNIRAIVGNGSTGHVKVSSLMGKDSLAGFLYLESPTISSFLPTSATAGETITINGTNFINVSSVSFGGVQTSFTVNSPNSITAIAPSGSSGDVQVITPGGTATLTGFSALPKILSFSPGQGTEGTIMTILGTSFTGTTGITIGGIPVLSFTVISSDSISAVVAAGASGEVRVTKPEGSSVLPGFTWVNTPVITSFSPITGNIGTQVTITGTNFSSVPAENIVYFGGVKSNVSAATSTSLTVSVPVHATFNLISVTTNNLTAYSSKPFLVTFPGGGSITSASFSNYAVVDSGTNSPRDGRIADFDGDGKPDIIVSSRGPITANDGIYLYRNTGNISGVSFDNPYHISNSGYVGVNYGDLDGDGKLDFALYTTDSIYPFRNTSLPGTISFDRCLALPSGGPFGIGYTGITIGDVDGDGKPEIISRVQGNTRVFRNISNPEQVMFAPPQTYPGGGRNIALIDMDGDGKPEIVTPDTEIRILKNSSTKGNLNFSNEIILPGYIHSYLAVGDMDGDGKTDIVSGDVNGSRVAVFLNTSTTSGISFAAPLEISCRHNPEGIAVDDLDGDGKLDIVSSVSMYSFATFKNFSTPGNLSFSEMVNFNSDPHPLAGAVVIGDLNGDGKPEVVSLCETGKSLLVHLNEVNPSPQIQSFSPTNGGTGTMVTITGNNFTGVTAVSFGGIPASSFVVNSSTSISAVVGAGGDGPIVVTNNFGSGEISGFVFGFLPSITSISPTFAEIGATVMISGNNFSTVPADNIVYFDQVKAEVTSASQTSLSVTVPPGAGHQQVTVTVNNLTAYSRENFSVTIPGSGSSFTSASFAPRFQRSQGGLGTLSDIDGDGKLDLAMVASTELRVARNTSTVGAFSFESNITFPRGGNSFSLMKFGDLDGDGKKDVVLFNYDSSSITIIQNLSSPGNIVFGTPDQVRTGVSTTRPSDGTIQDIDGDGKPEIIVANYYSHTVSIFKNASTNGSIVLGDRIDIGFNGYPTGIIARDLNNDGKPELIVTVNSDNVAKVFINTSMPGTVSFALGQGFPVRDWPDNVVSTDVDGNGALDIISLNNDSPATVDILQNLSSGGNVALGAVQSLSLLNPSQNLSAGDMDGDGKPDLVVTYSGSVQSLSIYKNGSSPGNVVFEPRFDLSAGVATPVQRLGDVDGDGLLDIVLFDYANVYIFRNLMGNSAVTTVCENVSTTITSNITGTAYQWQEDTGSGFINLNNNTNYAGVNSATLQINNTPVSFNGYRFRCLVSTTDTSVVTTLRVNAVPLADAGIDSTICAGSSIQLQGSGTGTYQWSPAASLSDPTIAGPIANPAANTTYVLTVTNSSGCVGRDTVNITVSQVSVPSITISAPSTDICTGGSITFTAVATNGGSAPSYQWLVNGMNAGANSPSFTTNTLNNNDEVKCILTSNAVCVSPLSIESNSLTVSVNASAPASVSITSTATTICAGTSVTFTAAAVNGGSSPSYQWKVNGANVGTDSPTYSSSTLTDGDLVELVLTSSLSCAVPQIASSNVIAITVNNAPVPTISFTASANNICSGETVTFTSTSVNVGATPQFQWKVNGLNVGQNTEIFSANNFVDGDVVSLAIISSADCADNTPLESSPLTINVDPGTPGISISGDTATSLGIPVIVTATTTFAGASPAYQWQDSTSQYSWRDLAGATQSTLSYSPTETGAKIRCRITSSSGCSSGQVATSNTLTFSGINPPDPIGRISVRVFPNPARTFVVIDSLKLDEQWESLSLVSVNGTERMVEPDLAGRTSVTINISNLPVGLYLIRLRRKSGEPFIHRILKQ